MHRPLVVASGTRRPIREGRDHVQLHSAAFAASPPTRWLGHADNVQDQGDDACRCHRLPPPAERILEVDVLRRRLHLVASGAGVLWAVATRFIPLVCAPFFFYVGYGAARAASPWLLGACVLAVATGLGIVILVWLRFTEAGRAALRSSQEGDLLRNLVTVIGLVAASTTAFTGLSSVVQHLGWDPTSFAGLSSRQAADAAYISYIWHLCDAVPLLEVPDTLNWTLERPLEGSVQGGLTLAYLVVVVLPLLYVATRVLKTALRED